MSSLLYPYFLLFSPAVCGMRDPSSSANIDEATIDNIFLDWDVDFAASRIYGTASLDVRILKSTDTLILDGRGLDIRSMKAGGQQLKHIVEDAGVLGEKIVILMGERKAGDKVRIDIDYSTASGTNCTALLFLKAEQTADKKGPYLYSQCQAIHARSLMPCMDTPAVKQTYHAKVSVPKGLTCLMSAIADGAQETSGDSAVFKFSQPIPIPSYLLAIVVGVLKKRDISERCAVWSEPSIVDKAHFEFSETEKMLAAAEELVGKYVWGRYDLVVLPPSFPFGGMENPCLTFVTPTLLAGDKSMANVITHEIAHSWTGNLVTNANWEHFWLNEGFTVFLERKIIGKLEGEEMRQFHAQTGWEDSLLPCIKERFTEDHPYTKLVPSLQGIDPDDTFSSIPYEKGSALLMHIEQLLQDEKEYEAFFKRYVEKFAYKSIISSDWKSFLYENCTAKKNVLDSIEWDKWFYAPGVPPNQPKFDGSLLQAARELADRWISSDIAEVRSFDTSSFRNLSSKQQIKVLDCIRAADPLPHEKVERLDSLYDLSKSGNSEIVYTWIEIALKARWKDILPLAFQFVTSQGRLKFVRPLYSKLFLWTESAGQAIHVFQKNAPFMHPITASIVSKLIPK